MGVIVNRNANPLASDTWALVSNFTVVNTITADYNDILAIQNSYDYFIDTTVSGQNAGPGWSYDGVNFNPPGHPILNGKGTIVNMPTLQANEDQWALVNGNVVQQVITANFGYISSIQNSYDYLIDVTVGRQANAVAGGTYDSVHNTFTLPVVNNVAILQTLVDTIASDMQSALNQTVGMAQQDVNTACINATGDSSGGFTPNEALVFASVTNWIIGGG